MSSAPANDSMVERLKNVQVGVRPELEFSRHIFHGEPAYVVRDPITFKSHRLSREDYQIVLAIHRNESLGTIFTKLVAQGRLASHQEESFYQFVLSLAQIGLLNLPVSDGGTLYRRFERKRAAQFRSRLTGVLFLQVPLIQPDRFLERTVRYVGWLFAPTTQFAWALAMLMAIFLVVTRSSAFNVSLANMLTLSHAASLWILLILLKTFHELGHAYACKYFGGRVPEMGAYFILFTPCAYVDASASWGFPNRWHRIAVALGGMYFESFAAIAATVVWSLTDPGWANSTAQSVMLLSTIVTIGFNANPLMKYDGYYVLCDLLGMPNLRTDAQQLVAAALNRFAFGIETPLPARSRYRQTLLIGFGILSSIYKFTVVVGMTIAIAYKLPLGGLVVATVYAVASLRRVLAVVTTRIARLEHRKQRWRAFACVTLLIFATSSMLTLLPAPQSAHSLGVVAQECDAVVHAATAGFLTEINVQDGDQITADTILCRLDNPSLPIALHKAEAEQYQRQVELQTHASSHPERAAAAEQELRAAQVELAERQADAHRLAVRAPAGRMIMDEPLREVGKYVTRGTPLARVGSGEWIVHTLLSESEVMSIRPNVGDPVSLKLVAASRETLAGEIYQVSLHTTSHDLPPPLTTLGGGTIAVDPITKHSVGNYFSIRVRLRPTAEQQTYLRHGMTAWVRYSDGRVPIGRHLYRGALNLLNRLHLKE